MKSRNFFAKNKQKKGMALFFTMFFFLVVLVPCPVKAVSNTTKSYTIPEIGMTVEIPDDLYVFTQDVSLNNPDLLKAGVTNPAELIKKYEENNVYLNAISEGGTLNITISQNSTSTTQDIYNLNLLEGEKKDQFYEEMNRSSDDQNVQLYKVTPYDGNPQQAFFKIELKVTPLGEEKTVSEICYATILNGYTISIDTYADGELSAETDEILRKIADSAVFSDVKAKPQLSQTAGIGTIVIMLAPLVIIIAAILIPIIVAGRNKRKMKKQHTIMMEKLTAYRKKQVERENREKETGEKAPQPETLFANVTDYPDSAVKKYCIFRVFVMNPVPVLITEIIGILSVILSLFTDGNGWLRFILFALGVLCIIWPVFTYRRTLKMQQKVCKSYRSRTALYYFREEDFHITELQSASTYPYFQISSVYETERYFYFYFNENQVYFVDKNGFKFGTTDNFRDFLKKQMGKQLKQRTFFK